MRNAWLGRESSELENMTEKTRTRLKHVPLMLCMTGACLLFVAGCGKAEKAAEKTVDPSSPESYMNDSAFRQKLSADRKERQRLLRSRAEIVGQMKAMIDAKKRELQTNDLAAVKAVLDKDPAWQELSKKCEEANAQVEASRQATLKTVRARITPKESISK